MNINSFMSGLIPPAQLLQVMLNGLQNEVGFEIKKADLIYNRRNDRMYFEVCLPEGTPINYADKDQFTKCKDPHLTLPDGNVEVWKRYAYGDKETIKSALIPLFATLTGEEIKAIEDVDVMVIRYNVAFEIILAMTVNGESKQIIKQIS